MHPRLEGWLQKWRKQKKEGDSPPPHERIPTLPSPRPRPITPTPDNGLVAQPQTQSPFFGRLPLELRQLIYGHLFGNRVVHLRQGYQYPRRPGGAGHAGWGTPRRDGTRVRIDYHYEQRNGKRWISQGCGCCRDAQSCWWDDECSVGRETQCSSDVRDCTIDARWLLVCRQGYLESVDMLYSTNTFHPRSLTAPLPDDLSAGDDDSTKPNQITLLRATLLPHRFAQISRLHITAYSPSAPPHPSYERLCRSVLALPGLRELRLAVTVRVPRWQADPRTPPGPALDAAWLGVMDAMVAERGLGSVEFVVPESYWDVFDRRGAEVVLGGEGCAAHRRFWRAVDGGEQDKKLGYWIAGMADPPLEFFGCGQ